MTKQVFISYSHANKEQADAICHKLESENIACWIAPRDISPSNDWAEEIIDAINSVSVMVLVFSSHSNSSPQVRREVERAVHKGVNVLPFRIEDIIPSKSLEYFISTQHWLDACTGSFNRHLDELYNSVKRLTNKTETVSVSSSVPEQVERVAVWNNKAHESPSFSESDLNHFSASLAHYLGPMAKIIVNKKAAQSTSLPDLVSDLCKELENEKERIEFMQACQSRI